jgi:hypothetical protein
VPVNPLLSPNIFLSFSDLIRESMMGEATSPLRLDHPVKLYDDMGDTPKPPAGEKSPAPLFHGAVIARNPSMILRHMEW